MSGIKVSIGMIVKNEEKYLRKCLESLKPISDNISTELVIVDTGSTDKTVEIAKEFTDKVYFFKWIDDFAAARNFGLLKCTGEWFMYTDADTIFETTEENMRPLIDFFKNDELNKKFTSATYTTRNYYNPSCKDFSEHKELRITRRTPNLRFIYSIHEVFNIPATNVCILDTYAHHHGYAFRSLTEANEKSRRNCKLLKKEIEKNPKDIRLQCSLFDSTIEHDEKVKIIEEATRLAKTSNEKYAPTAFFRAARYFADSDHAKATKYANEYIARVSENDATLIDIYFKLGVVSSEKHEYKKALGMFEKCYTLQKAYDEGKADMQRLMFGTLNGIGESAKAETFNYITHSMANLDMTAEAFEFWEKECGNFTFTTAIFILKSIVKISNDCSKLGGIYERMISSDTEKAQAFEIFLETLHFEFPDRAVFVDELSKGGGDFAAMMRLAKLGGNHEFKKEFELFIENFKWRAGFSELLYLMLANGIDVRPFIPSMNFELIRELFETLSKNHSDLALLIYGECKPNDFLNSMAEVLWLTCAFESVIFCASQKPNDNIRLYIYKNYTEILSIYVLNLYNSDLLNDADINTLPELHRFGYHMSNAQKKLESGDKIGYVRTLKTALLSCECAKDIVVALIDEIVYTN